MQAIPPVSSPPLAQAPTAADPAPAAAAPPPFTAQTADELVDHVLALEPGSGSEERILLTPSSIYTFNSSQRDLLVSSNVSIVLDCQMATLVMPAVAYQIQLESFARLEMLNCHVVEQAAPPGHRDSAMGGTPASSLSVQGCACKPAVNVRQVYCLPPSRSVLWDCDSRLPFDDFL